MDFSLVPEDAEIPSMLETWAGKILHSIFSSFMPKGCILLDLFEA
ncbi:hypothetical protein LEP1GSC050_3066 [Leptospira broomii serovar Hurstbridge str. 5399]|uniref:Uncharacterized protein n=1 Tax=Leptospira broomii serovar Hurstbridge str. 5399 TaxID=1049789 RepID=T0FCS1_9LEPT|nr:hypothetical protein [Leptospira broomii]EQA45402.1 hypothetical protein LEP1GSC050_3066 [Leptospira broomii serovar Hurstbridge str. 5399]